MSIFESSRSPWTSWMLSILRIVAGLLFLEHGAQKLFNFPPSAMPNMFPVAIATKLGLAGVIETFGGLAIFVGLFTRPVAFIAAGEMAYAYFTAHFPKSFYPIQSGGEPAVLFCFIWLYFMVAGAGPWSVDAMIARSKSGGASSA